MGFIKKFALSIFLMSSTVTSASATGVERITGSPFLCVGGYGQITIYSDLSGVVTQTSFEAVRQTISGFSVITNKNIVSLKKKLKLTRDKKKQAKLKKQIKDKQALFFLNAKIGLDVESCASGLIVSPGLKYPVYSGISLYNSSLYSLVGGAEIRSQDGRFIGVLSSNRFLSDSIANEFGSYGSKFSSTSIFNNFSSYGSQFSTYSAFNQFSSAPPILYIDQSAVAYLTANQFKTPRVDSYELAAILGRLDDTP